MTSLCDRHETGDQFNPAITRSNRYAGLYYRLEVRLLAAGTPEASVQNA